MAHVYLMKSDLKVGFSQGQLIVKEREEPKEQKTLFATWTVLTFSALLKFQHS